MLWNLYKSCSQIEHLHGEVQHHRELSDLLTCRPCRNVVELHVLVQAFKVENQHGEFSTIQRSPIARMYNSWKWCTTAHVLVQIVFKIENPHGEFQTAVYRLLLVYLRVSKSSTVLMQTHCFLQSHIRTKENAGMPLPLYQLAIRNSLKKEETTYNTYTVVLKSPIGLWRDHDTYGCQWLVKINPLPTNDAPMRHGLSIRQ